MTIQNSKRVARVTGRDGACLAGYTVDGIERLWSSLETTFVDGVHEGPQTCSRILRSNTAWFAAMRAA